jgi:hypothetical protein
LAKVEKGIRASVYGVREKDVVANCDQFSGVPNWRTLDKNRGETMSNLVPARNAAHSAAGGPIERIENKILLIRSQKVMIDKDLAELYGVKPFVLNQAVKRNKDRFPEDFMFQLTKEEWRNLIFQSGISNLKSQIVISSWGGRRTTPYAFTEQGVAMLSSVFNSKRAIQVNILIMRVFTKLKNMLSAHKELARKIEELESRVDRHDLHIVNIIKAIKKLMEPKVEEPVVEKLKKIGFIKEG